jgi:hypothetical protein
MNPQFFGLNEKIGRIIKVPADQSRIVSIAVAMAAAAHARLPSSQVENVSAFFAEQVFGTVSESISDLNESIVFGAKSALEYAQLFWKLRYYAAFPAHLVDNTAYAMDRLLFRKGLEQMDLTTIWAGGVLELSEEMNLFMNKYRTEIVTLAADLTRLMAPKAANVDEDGRG